MFTSFTSTAEAATDAIDLIDKITVNIFNPLIKLFFGIALLFFLYGVYEIIKGDASEDARTIGRQHVLWGVVGMFIMVSAFGIMHLICGTIGCR